MTLLRLAELIVFMLLVAWTVVFPLATLLSLLFTLPVFALVGARLLPPRSALTRA